MVSKLFFLQPNSYLKISKVVLNLLFRDTPSLHSSQEWKREKLMSRTKGTFDSMIGQSPSGLVVSKKQRRAGNQEQILWRLFL